VHGTFKIVVEDQETNQNPTDGPERVVVSGHLNGRIDLSLAFFGPDGLPNSGDETTPVGSMDGRWSAVGVRGGGPSFEDVRAHGTLQGVFRLPFPVATTPGFPFGAAYLLDDLTTVVPVLFPATSLGRPTVRLDVKFEEQL
jgi:hypothetical protein